MRSRSKSRSKRSRSKSRPKVIGNSSTFYKRLKSLSPSSRVPKKYEGENPAHHSDLYTDENPKGTVHGLKFRNKTEAKESVSRLHKLVKSGKITYAHFTQIVNTMIQRAKHHAHPTQGIKEGIVLWYVSVFTICINCKFF